MDEEKEKQMNVDVVDTPEEEVENERRVEAEERIPENKVRADNYPVDIQEEELAPLFEGDEAKKFRSRWLAIQSKFVDDPSDSVKQADDLVSDVIKSVTMNFSNRRIALENQWNGGEAKASTEDLRMAIKRYRSFFDRLLTLES
jgi:hypothetical protein